MAIAIGSKLCESVVEDEPISISVVAPTLNEIGNIENYIETVSDNLKHVGRFEIVVVDDNSVDGTKEFLSQRKSIDDHLRVVLNDKREGLSNSQLKGICLCSGNFKIVMDSDLQHPAENIRDIAKALDEGYDIVVCSRYVEGGSVGNRHPVRGIISRGAIMLTHILISRSRCLKDPVSGFYGFRKEMRTVTSGYCRGYKSLLYLLVMNENIKVKEIPFEFKKRNESSSKIVENWRFFIYYFMEVLYVAKLSYVQRHAGL